MEAWSFFILAALVMLAPHLKARDGLLLAVSLFVIACIADAASILAAIGGSANG